MNGMGFLGGVVLVFLGLVVGVPLIATLGGLVVAVLAFGFVIAMLGAVFGALFSIFGLLFRLSCGLAGLIVTLLGGAIMIGLAAAIASHLLPLLLLGALIWFVVRQSNAQPKALALA